MPKAVPSTWIKCISTGGTIRGVAIQATELAREMASRHGLTGVGAKGVGEAAVAGLLLSSYCKVGERVNLNIRGSGYYSQALIDAYPDGRCRGFVIPRQFSTDEERDRVADGGPWGDGLMSVLRSKDAEGQQPYIGTVPLVTGHLAKDLAFYWFQSEQVPTAAGIAVTMDGDQIKAAGGFLVQAMPGATAQEISVIENHLHSMHALADEYVRDPNPIQILAKIFQSLAFVVVEERPLLFRCDCSEERVSRALTLMGSPELKSILKEDGQAIVHCDFCSKEYQISKEQLQAMIDQSNEPATPVKPKRP